MKNRPCFISRSDLKYRHYYLLNDMNDEEMSFNFYTEVSMREINLLSIVPLYFSEFVMGTAVPDMQLGCAWIGENLITVSLSGNINYLDRNNPTYPMRVIKVCEHRKNINTNL